MPRLVGNTKNRDVPCGSPTSAELFHKFPNLEAILLSSLIAEEDNDRFLLISGGLCRDVAVESILFNIRFECP